MLTEIQTKKPNKNKFDLSREAKLTTNMGDLVPVFMQDVIPGDSFQVNTQQLIRFAPMLAPAMHRIDFKIDYFYVPYRLIWDEWKDFITGGEDGNDLPSHPRLRITNQVLSTLNKGTLADYLGLPANVTGNGYNSSLVDFEISSLPFRAYQLIYHEYFRDQNLASDEEQYTESGIADLTQLGNVTQLKKTNWEKDYFTSALPFLQRGPEVTLPLGTTAELLFDTNAQFPNVTKVLKQNGSPAPSGDLLSLNSGSSIIGTTVDVQGSGAHNIDVTQHTLVDLSNATAATLNELRKASALQQWMELMARAGSRYREQIFAMFGERIPDYTVQVPQYLGGGKTPVMISEVLNNYEASGNGDDPVGTLSGHGVGLGEGLGFTQSFDEHGIILGLARVVPRSSYVQGLSKFWQKFDKFDHFFPQFANLGEQEVKNSEIFITGIEGTDNDVFGYQQRYAEYKYSQDTIAGDFVDELAYWELSRRFTSTPVLNQSFVECNPDDRIFAVTDNEVHKIWIQLYHEVNALRPIPYHANPMLT